MNNERMIHPLQKKRRQEEMYTRNTGNKVDETKADRNEQEKQCLVKIMTGTEQHCIG